MKADISIVMPTYNQAALLTLTLRSFEFQRKIDKSWELILINDGSEDNTEYIIKNYNAPFKLRYISRDHRGRAAARNVGINETKGDLVVFCDGDRPVSNYFLYYHFISHRHDNYVVVGATNEFYFSNIDHMKKMLLEGMKRDFESLKRVAREPVYVKKVFKMYNADGETVYAMPWITFLTGNVSLKAHHIKTEKFDEIFKNWGFEHFELGFRLFNKGLIYRLQRNAINYHLAHGRKMNFYKTYIDESYRLFYNKHRCKDVYLLKKFLNGKISLQKYHNSICSCRNIPCVSGKNEIFYRQPSMI